MKEIADRRAVCAVKTELLLKEFKKVIYQGNISLADQGLFLSREVPEPVNRTDCGRHIPEA